MKKLTIVGGGQLGSEVSVSVTENNTKSVYKLPVGVEIAVSDALAQAVTARYDCIVGYFVANAAAAALLPTTGIADGSYCMLMDTQILRFLSGGAWV